MSDAFIHGLRSNKTAMEALQAAVDALSRLEEVATVLYHEIGSYAFATTAGHLEVQPGDIVAGSDLRMAGSPVHQSLTRAGEAWSYNFTSAVALPGSWRCMGYVNYSSTTTTATHAATLWVRVA